MVKRYLGSKWRFHLCNYFWNPTASSLELWNEKDNDLDDSHYYVSFRWLSVVCLILWLGRHRPLSHFLFILYTCYSCHSLGYTLARFQHVWQKHSFVNWCVRQPRINMKKHMLPLTWWLLFVRLLLVFGFRVPESEELSLSFCFLTAASAEHK